MTAPQVIVGIPMLRHLGHFREWWMVKPVLVSESENSAEFDCRYMLYDVAKWSDGKKIGHPLLHQAVSFNEMQKIRGIQ